ncbi:MAG: BamA/TamA family outer membrane protein [Methylococcaceae bacterium]|nr:BamA/TamA family outer membrane protein [Methylococcaceae bacterium]
MTIKSYKNATAIIWLIIIRAIIFQNVNANEDIAYHVEIQGVKNIALKKSLLSYSIAHQQEDSLPSRLFALEHRAKKDIPIFIKLLRSKAYFNSKIAVEFEKKAEDTALIFRFELGKPYLLKQVNIELDAENLEKPSLKLLNLELDKPALTTAILDAEQTLLNYAKEKAHAFAKLCPKKVVVNHDLQTVNVDLCLNAGKRVYLGAVSFTGNDNVEAEFLTALIKWEQGVLYNQLTLDTSRLKLVDSRLFTVARLHLASEADENGHFPVTFELKERLPRTISAGLRLTTDDELFLFRFAWEHRNLWREGEAIETELNISMVKSSLEGSFRKPVFYAPENTFVANAAFITEDTDAYESLRAEFSATIEHQYTKKMRVNGGLAYQFSRVTEKEEISEDFSLVSLPMRFSWDFSDNFLEPTSGGRLWIDEQPFYDLGSGASFHKQKIRYNHYFSLSDDDDFILAGRIILGNIWGADIQAIPADLRYFAGGGDTVRGYSYQSLSPKDSTGDLIGGRSLLSLSTEFRAWVTDSIGVVAFVDAGRAYAGTYQDIGDELQIGAGLGLRYKTPIGALRLDLARPINKREEDDEFQVYISIGHTF